MISTQPLYDTIQRECGSLFATEAHPESSILRYIGSAIRYICNNRDYEFLKKRFTATVITADVPVSVPEIVKVTQVTRNNVVLTPVGIEDYYHPDATNECVLCVGTNFYAKVPGEYQIIASYIPAVPTSQTDTIDLPSYVYDIILTMAMSFAYSDVQVYNESERKKSQADAMLQAFSSRASSPRPANTRFINVRSPK